ncbi:vanadium-dependent haloperoxidase [Flavihumibacter rivuli]|uniref:vanadium-dependent haloperoxidase n=1 Tax=Flavihumibacter rivuli TaxID=2838156 RepID=UPI001BDE4B40|nr:vanadium-dependent haloperoxidase [Flavihumibacter rivuli]ULQ55472.1 vanadium-dependent haloperoxidase [Flavihumibacter rivuli]
MKKINLPKLALIGLLAIFAVANQACRKGVADEVVVLPAKNQSSALPHTKQYPAEVATEWFMLLTEISRTKPYFSPQSLRIFSYSGMALYESVVPGMPSYQSMYHYFTGNTIMVDKKKDYYWPAAANAAIARIASKIMENYPAPNLSAVQALESTFNTRFQSEASPERLQFSREFGSYVADLIYEWSKTDGTLNADGSLAVCPPYTPLGGPGNWVPTPPFFLPVAGACQGNLNTYIPNIANTVLAPPPPAYSTDPGSAFYQAALETATSRNNISTDETNQFNNWRDIAPNYNPLAHMLRISTQIMVKEGLNLEDAATLYAKQTIAGSDAIIAVFKSKFHYSLLRPVTYIRNVLGQGTWSSLPNTPQTPSYPDEMSATASSVAILENYFGTNYSFVDDIHKATHGEWTYTSFDQMLEDIVQARVSGGTTFRFAGDAGINQGRLVGNMVDQLPFKKL